MDQCFCLCANFPPLPERAIDEMAHPIINYILSINAHLIIIHGG